MGCPKTLNTEKDYYSNDAENYLSAEIETPLGQIIKQLKGSLHEDKGFRLNQGIYQYNFKLSLCITCKTIN